MFSSSLSSRAPSPESQATKGRASVYFLMGPTAVGKTEAALVMAPLMQAEIISADSMQVYRQADIISAKPTFSERAQVRHHLVGCLDPNQEWNVADFRKAALDSIQSIIQSGKRPLIVGGSGLYVRTLIGGIFKGPSKDLELRQKLEERSPQDLWKQLHQVDPQAAKKIKAQDVRRLVRALEVYQMTQTPISNLHDKRTGLAEQFDIHIAGLVRSRESLYQRVDQRVDHMFKEGLVEEVEQLIEGSPSLTLSQCIGLKEIQAALRGEVSLEQAQAKMKQATRRFVKRQFTWFRRESQVKWFEIGGQEFSSCHDAAYAILKHWEFV